MKSKILKNIVIILITVLFIILIKNISNATVIGSSWLPSNINWTDAPENIAPFKTVEDYTRIPEIGCINANVDIQGEYIGREKSPVKENYITKVRAYIKGNKGFFEDKYGRTCSEDYNYAILGYIAKHSSMYNYYDKDDYDYDTYVKSFRYYYANKTGFSRQYGVWRVIWDVINSVKADSLRNIGNSTFNDNYAQWMCGDNKNDVEKRHDINNVTTPGYNDDSGTNRQIYEKAINYANQYSRRRRLIRKYRSYIIS